MVCDREKERERESWNWELFGEITIWGPEGVTNRSTYHLFANALQMAWFNRSTFSCMGLVLQNWETPSRERQVQLTSSSRVSTKHRLFQTQLEKAGWGDWGNSKQEVFDRALGILFLGYSIFLLFQILLLLNPFLQPKSWPCLQSITLSLQ